MIKQEVTKRLPVKKAIPGYANYQCSVIGTLHLFASKWKPCILCYLAQRPMRYNQLHRIIPNISRKMLSEHLKELEKAMLIIRLQYDNKLQRVEYSLSEKGKSLLPILEHLGNWGMNNIKDVKSIKEMLAATMENV